jgi:Mg-chelatase subunit ChlD
MKKFYTLLFTFLSVLSFAGGMHIRGFIKDMDTKQPVANAFVSITFYKGVVFSDVTDSIGQYDIETTVAVPEADYDIFIHAQGYYDPSGFIHVTKDCFRDFTIKKKPVIDTVIPIVKAEELVVVKTETIKPALEGFATNNLVFLIDISSSMNAPERLPLLKESLRYLVNELRTTDNVAILTFSNVVKEVLPSTAASNKELILKTIDELTFGSTSQGGAALNIAYKTATKNFIPNGNNRIVLASDGLFTSGEKDYKKMQETIQNGLAKNITVSIFCFGKNTEYVNGKLRTLAQTGKGNFANILNIDDAKLHMLEEAKAVVGQ